MPLALVTGPPDQVGSAGAALGRAGFDVVGWETATPPPPRHGEPFDCYVQLPCGEAETGGGAGTGARGGPGPRRAVEELVYRIDALAAVAGRLGPTASILLGVDESGPSDNPGSGTLAPDLLAAVALALLEDLGRPGARVAVLPVADLCRAPAVVRLDDVQWEIPTPPLVSAP
jgi:hypothetical protein